jgi:hypothetical protein
MVLIIAIAEVVWLRRILHERGFTQNQPNTIYSNSQNAIKH